jgi:hypothetical protein
MSLTQKQKITNFETLLHIQKVRNYLNVCIRELLRRGEEHDQTKMDQPELDYFTEYTDKLAKSTYGSEEYEENKEAMQPALDHHYANNRHHPEHFKNGVEDMTLLDLVEMFCDWKASSERHNDGNLRKSIEINGERFAMSEQLIKIFENTIETFG